MLFSTLFMSTLAYAGCGGDAQQAIQMCKTEAIISDSSSKSQAIEKAFHPANGRMSPESCQGFLDGYSDFQRLTVKYIQNCQQKISAARASCKSETPAAVSGDASAFENLVQSAKTLKSAEKELPKLQALIPPMDNLKSKLADCLRDTPGRIANTNSDRGDAKNANQLQENHAGGSPLIFPASQTSRVENILGKLGAKVSHVRDASAPLRADPSVLDPQKASRQLVERKAKTFRDLGPQSLASRTLQLRDGRGGLVTIVTHQEVFPTRGPASFKSHRELANRHRNIFSIIKERYKANEQSFWP